MSYCMSAINDEEGDGSLPLRAIYLLISFFLASYSSYTVIILFLLSLLSEILLSTVENLRLRVLTRVTGTVAVDAQQVPIFL